MDDPRNLESAQEPFFAPARAYDGAESGRVKRVRDAASSVYSLSARRALSRLLDEEQPDIAHLHNVYHQLTLSVVDELHSRGIPIVQTLHDWKIACPAYTLYLDGAPCRRCVDGNVLSAIKNRCIKGSAAGSALAALEAALAHRRGTYLRISRYIAPSAFAGSVASMAGMPADRIRLVPYLMPDDEIGGGGDPTGREPVFFFGGRLDETKGVRQMLAAFDRLDSPATLRIAGWGDLQVEVEAAALRNPRIQYLGTLTRTEVLSELSRARALLLPSTWEDNCPLIMLEAQARSTPVIASDRGGPPEFVRDGQDGLVIDPDDVKSLATAIDRLAGDPELASDFGRNGRARLLATHGVDDHYVRLMDVYADAITTVRADLSARRSGRRSPA